VFIFEGFQSQAKLTRKCNVRTAVDNENNINQVIHNIIHNPPGNRKTKVSFSNTYHEKAFEEILR
jgi:phage baseplate assembly protein W